MEKKIVHIIVGLNVGGAELMLRRLVLHSQKHAAFSHEIVSLTDKGTIGEELINKGIPVHTLGMQSGTDVAIVLFKLRKLIKQLNPDVVQTWMYHADLLGGLAAKSLGIKKIIWGIRNTALDPNSGSVKKLIRKSCAKLSYSVPTEIVCVAHKAKDLHANIGYCKEKIVVIPNGFDVDRFKKNDELRNIYRTELGISNKKLVLGNIGRFAPAKNQVSFIKACISLLNKGYDFDIILAGRDVNTDNAQIKELVGSRTNFKIVGQLDKPEKFYNAIDVFCLTSLTEGFPNVLGEAMLSEKVCLTTDAGDAKEILGNSGYHILSPSVHDIEQAIEDNILKSKNPNFNVLAEHAREHIKMNYSLDKIVKDFESLY